MTVPGAFPPAPMNEWKERQDEATLLIGNYSLENRGIKNRLLQTMADCSRWLTITTEQQEDLIDENCGMVHVPLDIAIAYVTLHATNILAGTEELGEVT